MDPRRRLLLRGALRPARAAEVPAPLRPPWSLADEAEFQARCTRCRDCAAACPRGLIVRGDGGFPVLDFSARGCDLCGQCLAACRTGALARPAGESSGTPLRARARASGACLTLRQVECRLCDESCEPRALRFDLAPGGIARLRIDLAACHGCGECVSTCPVGAMGMRAG